MSDGALALGLVFIVLPAVTLGMLFTLPPTDDDDRSDD